MKKGHQEKILTPGFNRRSNTFITLLWPKRKNGFIFNTYDKRRSREFKLHLSNLLQYAKRHSIKRVILFLDHANYHKTKNVRRFIRNHKILKVKFLPKKAPELNPIERLINKPLKSAISTNRSYQSINDVVREERLFLRKYQRTFGT